MSWFVLALRNAFRNRLRTSLTSLGVAIAIVAFLLLRTLISAWYAGVNASASDRLVVRDKTALIYPLPLAYVQKVRNLPGVTDLLAENWFGGMYIDARNFFAKFATDAESLFRVYPELELPEDQKHDFVADQTGCIVGDLLAEKYHWKIGDRVPIKGDIYPGDWTFTIRGVYTSHVKGIDRQTMFFHWKYLDERMDELRKSKVGFMILRVADPAQSTAVASAIDTMFANSTAETLTESEKSFQLEFVSMASAVLAAIEVVSAVVLIILMLILANTIAMATRERTTEYAMMRAIGFQPSYIERLVITEGFVIAFLGAALGVGMATPVMRSFSSFLDKNVGGFLGAFELDPMTALMAVGVALAAGMAAAELPALRAKRMKIVDALRKVE